MSLTSRHAYRETGVKVRVHVAAGGWRLAAGGRRGADKRGKNGSLTGHLVQGQTGTIRVVMEPVTLPAETAHV